VVSGTDSVGIESKIRVGAGESADGGVGWAVETPFWALKKYIAVPPPAASIRKINPRKRNAFGFTGL
jgi:hypothetical protein